MAKTIALAPQRRPSSKQAAATASKEIPPPSYSSGISDDRARASRRAVIVSMGKRALRSTSSAFGAATSSAIRRIVSRKAWSRSTVTVMPRPRSWVNAEPIAETL